MIAEPVYQSLLNLPAEERLDLMRALQQSLDQDQRAPRLSSEQAQELARRVTRLESGQETLVSWEAVKAQALAHA